jgi:hypothetical protein
MGRSFYLGIVTVAVILGFWLGGSDPAIASIRKLQEAPGQMVYQSRSTLVDQQNHRWQAIAFRRIYSDGHANVYLRLVGFPGMAEIDRMQPLTFVNSLGGELRADDVSNQLFTEGQSVEATVGQYNVEPVLPDLRPELSWRLILTLVGDQPLVFAAIPSSVLEEWRALGDNLPLVKGVEISHRLMSK